MHSYNDHYLGEILKHWGFTTVRIHRGIDVAGSPERCLFRVVIEDRHRGVFLLENIGLRDLDRKIGIIKTLAYLHSKGLAFINPYMMDSQNQGIVEYRDTYWQLSPYIDGTDLKRPEYVFDGWRGEKLGDILVALNAVSHGAPVSHDKTVFSIKTYIDEMKEKLARHAPTILKRVTPIADFLEKDFMGIHDRLPAGFCHGDLHPLNVIWSPSGIKAVIDWEFTGLKPEIYDLALLVGCLGMEDPDCLFGELVERLLKKITQEQIYSGISLDCLPEFAVALRFAWLAEWLRKKDNEMIELECVFMELLTNHIDDLKNAWGTTL
jgi:homoserine kinase type II